ncbi:MAG: Chaperone SurA [Tenericutes bacterium ADurb.Bin087]|nr:MAG: Chaperone SurA [Tenericutes bacterium ADurb.Bin087]
MRKPRHFIAGLALSALLLVGCSKDLVADKNGNIVTVTIDGNPVHINAGDMFEDYFKSSDGLKDYYDAVYEVVVRALFEEEKQATERTEIYDIAALGVNDVKEQAKNNAKGGGKYDDELKKILKTKNVETLKELEEKLAYDEMQVRLKKQFFDGGEGAWIENAMEELIVGERNAAGDLILDDNGNPVYEGYLNNKLPYHVRHLLVKVGAANNDFVTGKISKDDANKLSSVIVALANHQDTFGLLANRYSEDEGSARQFGDLGIMNFTTNFVNEFKLGVYAYDALYNNDGVMTPAAKAAKLKIPGTAQVKLDTLGLDEIPYGAAIKLAEVREIEKSDTGKEVNDGKAEFFPRNVMFNKYFNKHNIGVITPNDVVIADEVGVENPAFAALPGFKALPELGGKKVLTDEKGNVILVVRAGSAGSYEGLHFIVVERSALYDKVNGVTLKDYYTIETPGTAAFPKVEGTDDDIDAFVNFLELDARGTKERIDKIRNEVKAFDPTINDRIFQKLVTHLDVKFHDAELKAALDKYLANQYARSQFQLDQDLDKLWSEWIEYLDQQGVNRAERLIPESYIAEFKAGNDYNYGG